MGNRELFENIRQGKLREVSFDELSALVAEWGFRLARIDGDDWVFEHPSRPGFLGVKACDGKVQVLQALYLLRILQQHELEGAP